MEGRRPRSGAGHLLCPPSCWVRLPPVAPYNLIEINSSIYPRVSAKGRSSPAAAMIGLTVFHPSLQWGHCMLREAYAHKLLREGGRHGQAGWGRGPDAWRGQGTRGHSSADRM